MNNKGQNTQKKANIFGGNRNKNDELAIEITKILKRPEIQSSTQCLIYKVPRYLRKWKEEAYTPQVVSIGPFHHKNKRLKAMEEYKERYFGSFVQRNKMDFNYSVGTIREMEESIRGCYAETIDLSSDRFVKMILVDACFILELFFVRTTEKMNPLIVEPRAIAVMLDLVLLENQLPFFVIEKIYHLAFPSFSDAESYDALINDSFDYFGCLNIRFRRQVHDDVKIEHFTDLLRTFQLPPPASRPQRGYQQNGLLYTATHLHEAGVKFEVVKSALLTTSNFTPATPRSVENGIHAPECRFDIKFEKGVLKIPKLELNDWTEVLTRNIMALEQTRYIEDAYFTDYLLLMDSLISTRKDVDFLCDKKILVNYLGDNNAVNSLINNINKGIIWITVRQDYIDLYSELNSFYDNPWHRRKATLKHEYFSTPWRGASTVAAIILLLLTFIQTTCSVFK